MSIAASLKFIERKDTTLIIQIDMNDSRFDKMECVPIGAKYEIEELDIMIYDNADLTETMYERLDNDLLMFDNIKFDHEYTIKCGINWGRGYYEKLCELNWSHQDEIKHLKNQINELTQKLKVLEAKN